MLRRLSRARSFVAGLLGLALWVSTTPVATRSSNVRGGWSLSVVDRSSRVDSYPAARATSIERLAAGHSHARGFGDLPAAFAAGGLTPWIRANDVAPAETTSPPARPKRLAFRYDATAPPRSL